MSARAPRQGQGQGQRIRLGGSDFVFPGHNLAARVAYLQSIQHWVPEAMQEAAQLSPDDDAAIRSWAERRGFIDEWAFDILERNIEIWRDIPETAGRWQSLGHGGGWQPVMSPPAWNIGEETEEAWRARVEVYASAMKAAMVRTPEKSGIRHFEWTVLYQVGGLSYSEIQAREPDPPDANVISEGIRSIADLTGLTLREPRRTGRPRKSSDSAR